jgi:hypothetical protein
MTLMCCNGWEIFAHCFCNFDSYKTLFALLTIARSFVVRLRPLFKKFGLCFVYYKVAGSVFDISEIEFRPARRLN